MKMLPPAQGPNVSPKVAMFSATTRGAIRKYTQQLVSQVTTPCVIVTTLDSPSYAAHWRAPVLAYVARHHRSPLAKARLFLRHIRNQIKLVNIARKVDVSIIHIQGPEPISLSMIWPLIKPYFKIVLSVHDVTPHEPYPYGLGFIQKVLLRRLQKQADALCVFSQYGCDTLVRVAGVNAQTVYTLPLGCLEPLPSQPPCRDAWPVRPVFLLFGSYRLNKGFEVLREAFLQIRRRGQPGLLHIAGEYPDMLVAETLDLFARNGFGQDIKFTNCFIQEEEIDELMRSSDVLVLPYTHYESQSGVLYLAYAYNLPIVASRVGGLTEMIESDMTGILVKPGDSLDLAAGLSKIAEHWSAFTATKPALLLDTKYSWERIGQLTDTMYTELLKK